MPDERDLDRTRLLVIATFAVLAAGLVIAALILVATGQGGEPRYDRPVAFGLASELRKDLREGGPIYFAGTTADSGFWLALEDGEIVALDVVRPGTEDCAVKWRDPRQAFVDCDDQDLTSQELARYPVEIAGSGANRGQLLVDLSRTDPPPAGIPQSAG